MSRCRQHARSACAPAASGAGCAGRWAGPIPRQRRTSAARAVTSAGTAGPAGTCAVATRSSDSANSSGGPRVGPPALVTSTTPPSTLLLRHEEALSAGGGTGTAIRPGGAMFADLVLEGGGVKGIALVGAISVLEERGYEFRRVAGTSAGAIVGSLVAAKADAAKLQEIMRGVDYTRFQDGPLWTELFLGRALSLLF